MAKHVWLLGVLVWISIPFSSGLKAQDPQTKALIMAVEQGNLKEAKALLKTGTDVHGTIPSTSPFYLFFLSREMYLNGLSKQMHHEAVYVAPIHANASRANQQMLKVLLKKRANIDAGDSEGKTPLMYALRSPGGEEYALLLIRKGANYTTLDHAGNTAMHYAAFGGNLEGVRMTLTGGTPINARNHQGITPIHAASVRADIDMLQAMVDLGADLNAVDSLGFNALHYAAGYGSVEKIHWLLAQAPDLLKKTKAELTPLDIAQRAGNDEVVKLLKSKGVKFSAYKHKELMDAIERRDHLTLKAVLDEGASPNALGDAYPLHLAAWNNDLQSLELLLKAGADRNFKNAKGWTPLDLAFKNSHPQACILLVENGAEPGGNLLAETMGQMVSASDAKDWEALAKVLIAKTPALDAAGGSMNLSPLHYAVYMGMESLVNDLLQAGASANLLDSDGWNALHWAVMKRDLLPKHPEKLAMAKLLVGKGCDPNLKSTGAKKLPHALPYLAKRVPAHATPTDLLQYALPKDLDMAAYLQSLGATGNLKADDFTENGSYFFQQKDYTTAMTELNKALQADPRNPGALYLRGECKRQSNLLEEAERDFTEAIKYAGPQPDINFARGKVRHDLGKAATAIQDFDVAVQKPEIKAEALYWRGRCHLKNNSRAAGCQDFRTAESLGNESAKSALKLYCE